jgi:TonB family protein
MPQRVGLRFLQGLIALLLVTLAIGVSFAKFPSYLSNYRVIRGVVPYRQNYVVLDDQILSNSRHDLGDLRLFAEMQEVPFELVTEHGDSSAEHTEAKILSAKRVGTETQFVLDVTGLPQCDQIDLKLANSARDFVSVAHVEGLRSPTERLGVSLGSSILFDLSSRGLGSGSTLKFLMARDPYLRIRMTKLAPEQVLQAVEANSNVGNPSWTALGGELPVVQDGEATVVTWDASEEAPVMRLVFKVDPSQINFWRDVEVLTPGGGTITNRSVRRIHLVHDGKLVESEWLDFTLPSEEWGAFRLVFHNGNELPIKITSARAYAYERRVYFNPQGRTSLALFYGNSRLGAPEYAHLPPLSNTGEPDALATLGPEMQNPERVPEGNGMQPFRGQLGGGVIGKTVLPDGTTLPAGTRIRVSGSVSAQSLINKVTPEVPQEAKAAHVSGTVILHAIIAKDGSVQELQYLSGPPLLMHAALDAARQWRYRPTVLNGEPVEMDTTIDVVFPPSGDK